MLSPEPGGDSKAIRRSAQPPQLKVSIYSYAERSLCGISAKVSVLFECLYRVHCDCGIHLHCDSFVW